MLSAIKKFPLLFVFALLTSAFLAFLGNWQYQKGTQREIEDINHLNSLNNQVIDLDSGYNSSELKNGSRVTLEGQFDSKKIIFHDNRLNLGKAGYHVYSLFKMDKKRTVLINRGWVAMNLDRRVLPVVSTNELNVRITGVIRFPVKGVFTLKDQQVNKFFPQRLQTIDIDKLSVTTGYQLEAFSVLLDESVKGDHFSRHWVDLLPGKYMSADKHYAYSLQWYSLSIVGFIVFMVLLMKLAKNEQD